MGKRKVKFVEPDVLKTPDEPVLTTEQRILKEIREVIMAQADYQFEGMAYFDVNDIDRALLRVENKYV